MDACENQRVESVYRRIAASGEVPAFARDVDELMRVAEEENAGVRRLVSTILKNQSLTARLISAVNSVYFNRGDREIIAVTQAVRLLGWDKVRDLASGLMLLEHFGRKAHGVKELMILSLLAAENARAVARRMGYDNPEEAYLAGMFAGLGELLAASHLEAEVARVEELKKEEKLTEREACRKVMGCTYEEIGRDAVARGNLPQRLAAGMSDPFKILQRPRETSERLTLISSFAHALTRAAHRAVGREGRELARELVARFGRELSITDDEAKEIVKNSVALVRESIKSSGVKLRNALAGEADVEFNAPVQEPVTTRAADTGLLARLMAELSRMVNNGEYTEPTDILMAALEAVYRGGCFDRVVLCLLDQTRTRVRGRLWVGEGAEELARSFDFNISSWSGPVSPVMLGRRPLLVESVKESPLSAMLFRDVVQAHSFGMLPVISQGRAIGCLYFDRKQTKLGLGAEDKQLLASIVEKAAAAFIVSRPNVSAPAHSAA